MRYNARMQRSSQSKLEIIFQNALNENVYFYAIESAFGDSAIGQSGAIINDLDAVTFTNRHVSLIVKLYFQLSPTERVKIIKALTIKLASGSSVAAAEVATITLFKIGAIEILLKELMKHTEYDSNSFLGSLNAFSLMLRANWDEIPSDIIDKSYNWVNNALTGKNKLGERIDEYPGLYREVVSLLRPIHKNLNELLTKEIETEIDFGYNPQINEDKQRLKDQIRKFGLPEDLSETLDKIDVKLETAQDNFDFKGTMDLIRSFTERLYEGVLSTYGEKGRKVHAQDSEEVAKFLKAQGLISQEFGAMIISTRHFLSNLGAHRLKSRPDDARLSKNITIEISLYLLKRLENN